MKTYAESQYERPFNWNLFLQSPNHDAREWNKAANKASAWITCACGNLCEAIPRHKEYHNVDGVEKLPGEPIDSELSRLGIEFMEYIQEADANVNVDEPSSETWAQKAKATLHQIEIRSNEILKEMGVTA